MLKKVFVILLAVLLLGACGGKPTIENSREIEIGYTTESEVEDILGNEHAEIVTPAGYLTYTYFTEDGYIIHVVFDGGFVIDVNIAKI